MPTVLLIRHAESKSNAGLPSFSPQSVPLTHTGRKQAKQVVSRLNPYLKDRKLDLIITSSYVRSKETAVPLQRALPHVPSEEWDVHEFTYINPRYKMYSSKEDRKPLVSVFWELAEPQLVDGPGAESFEQFITRVWKVKERLERSEYETVAVITHEQFILALLWLNERGYPQVDEEAMIEFRSYLEAHQVANGEIITRDLSGAVGAVAARADERLAVGIGGA